MAIDDRTLASRPEADPVEVVDKRNTAPAPPKDRARKTDIKGWARRHRRLTLIGAAILLVAIGVWLFVVPRLTGAGAKNFSFATVTRGNIETTVTALGNVQPKSYVDVGAQVSGQIKALDVEIGDTVKKGQLLAELDAQVQHARTEADKDNLAALQAQLINQQAQLVLKKAQYERQVRLDAAGATSKDNLQTAKATYESQKAQMDALRAQIRQAQSTLDADNVTLGYAKITAPMDGTVVSLPARLGQTINSVQQAPTLLRIADLSLMEIWTQVSEADVAKLKVGMPAYFTTLGNPGRRYNSTLLQILPTPETVNNVILYDVLFDIPNPDGSLMTQMTAQVFFVTGSAKNVLMVPAAAVHPLTGAGRWRGARSAQNAKAGGNSQRTRANDVGGEAPMTGASRTAPESGSNAGADTGPAGRTGPRRTPEQRAAFAASRGFVEVMGANGKIERRIVEIGLSDRVNTEIKSGLKEGEKVVVGDVQTANGSRTASQRPPGGNMRFRGRF